METTKLDLKERLQLSFQLKILEALYPSEAADYRNYRTAIERGYELHYQDIFEAISEEGLSEHECREVLTILEMYRGIIYSYISLERKNEQGGLTEKSVKFPGFDGNFEYKQMSYTKYFIDDLNRFSEIQKLSNSYYNSHSAMLPQYKNMLVKWKSYDILPNKYLMTEQDILNLLSVKNGHT